MKIINRSIGLLLLPLLAGCLSLASEWDDRGKLDWHVQREIVPKAASVDDVVKSIRRMGFRCGDYTDENRRSRIGSLYGWGPPNWGYEVPIAKICTAVTSHELGACSSEAAILIGSCDGLDSDAKSKLCSNRNDYNSPYTKVWAWVDRDTVCAAI